MEAMKSNILAFTVVAVSIIRNTISVPKYDYAPYEPVEISGRVDFSDALPSSMDVKIDVYAIPWSVGVPLPISHTAVTAPAGATYATYKDKDAFAAPDRYTLYTEAYFAGSEQRVKSNAVTIEVYDRLSLDSRDQYGFLAPTEFYVDGKYVGDAPVTLKISGTHTVEARSKMPWLYTWWKWSDGVTANPRSVYVSGYMTLIAYYYYVGGY